MFFWGKFGLLVQLLGLLVTDFDFRQSKSESEFRLISIISSNVETIFDRGSDGNSDRNSDENNFGENPTHR
jgi:hypothetical protein